MDRRDKLSELLHSILGSNNVYFSQETNIRMSYPAIVYSLDSDSGLYANNKKYLKNKRWEIILIGSPSELLDLYEKINDLDYSTYVRYYDADNLRHYVFSLYF